MSHRAVRALQAHVRQVLAAGKIKESKGLSKFHTMIMGVGKRIMAPFLNFHTFSLKAPEFQNFILLFVVVNTSSILIGPLENFSADALIYDAAKEEVGENKA